MARKKVSRTLARLPPPSALGVATHKTDRLLEILRNVAVENQKEQSQPFYSVRDVAQRFGVPLSTVSGIYRHLEKEGLLSRVRSSKTILQGLQYDRRLSVRAFVGLPASLSAFVTIQDYRMFFIRIRRELRLHGFATAMAFFKPEEAEGRSLSDRLKAYEVDTVIWFSPPASARETILRLSDMGVRLIGVAERANSVLPCRYRLRRQAAIKALLTEWKARDAVERVTVVESRQYRSGNNEETLRAATEELQIERMVITFNNQRSEIFLRSLTKLKTGGIIFPCSELASLFCFRRPNTVSHLLNLQRVAFVDGPVSMPFATVPDVRVDLVTIDWQTVAEKIVDDLITQAAFQRPGPTVFEAEAQVRVPLNRYSDAI